MRELLRTNDPVLLNFVQVLLKDAGIATVVFDGHMSVMEGSLGVLPRRLMVADDDADEAEALVRKEVPSALPQRPSARVTNVLSPSRPK